MRRGSESSDGCLAALPIAAALVILLARWLPIRFEFVPNDLGIVSLATLARYPGQQEMFWFAFALGAGTLLTWLFARAFRRAGASLRAVVGCEALGAAALLAVLWLPDAASALVCGAAVGGALWVASRGGPRHSEPVAIRAFPRPPARRPLVVAAWIAGAIGLALLIAPGFWLALWRVATGISDEQLTYDNFTFLGETGQHLAWANSILHGGFQGRDFFCLYGPLYDLSITGLWSLVGRSIGAYTLHWSLGRVLGWISLFLLGGSIVRRPALVLVLPFLLPWVQLRLGLALLGILCLSVWMRGRKLRWCVLAGLSGGVSLLYSQEYGAAFAVVAAVALVVRRDGRAAIAFGLAFAAVVAPLLAWFAAHDALLPMLADLVQYPRYMMAGYAKMIFPPLASSLPLAVSALGSEESLQLRLSYAVPALCLAALLFALPISAFDPRRPVASIREVGDALARDPARFSVVLIAFFGLLSFRVALGRSSLPRTLAVLPAAILLLGFAFDRLIDLWRRGPGWRGLAAWRSAALALFVLCGGFLEPPFPAQLVRKTVSNLSVLLEGRHAPVGSRHVLRVTRWVQLHTEPGEPVLFLPDDGAYYYLTDRPNPIRFVMGHQIVTDAHRREVLSDLSEYPPRFIVWDHDAYRVDNLPDELVFGRPLLDWIDRSYRSETRIAGVEVLRRIDPGS